MTIVEHEGVRVLRDDLCRGGTKRRVAAQLLGGADEWVFAGPSYGMAQVALAMACADAGKRATFFTAWRKEPHALNLEAMRYGCKIVWVRAGRIPVVQARAREYCAMTGARFIQLGLLLPGLQEALRELAVREVAPLLVPPPSEVWCVAGSGTLACALADAFPAAGIRVVQIGMRPHRMPERATVYLAPERFEQEAREPPPFPSAAHYDAKAWRWVKLYAQPGAFFWNVA